jgi:nicotinamidase-related amidase
MQNFILDRSDTALLVIDVQEKVFSSVERGCEILQTLLKVIEGFQIMQLPIFASEQYPQGLGETIHAVKNQLADQYRPFVKTTFSCVDDPHFAEFIKAAPYRQWVLVGVEAHICVLETAKGLRNHGKDVVILNDAISSRSIYDFSTAIAEMRDAGIRISCGETILFELLKDSMAAEFKQISQLVKNRCGCC